MIRSGPVYKGRTIKIYVMRKYLILTFTVLFFGFSATYGQQISICTNASGGGYAESGTGSMSFTIGQLVYKTAEDPTGIMTQGFQQPDCPPNSDPVADAGGAYILQLLGDLSLDGSGSLDPDGTGICGDAIVSWSWDLDNNGVFGDATGETPLVPWATMDGLGINTVGTYTIVLQVTDGNGATATASTTVELTDSVDVPTLGQWGLINMGLLLLCGGSVVIWRREYPLVMEEAIS